MSCQRILICFIVCLGLSCSRAANPNIERGDSYHFVDGFPEVRVSAIGYMSPADQPYISVTSDIVYNSLVYRYEDGKRLANVTVETMVTGKGSDNTFSETTRKTLDIERDDNSLVGRLEVFTLENDIYVTHGNFNVAVTVLDHSTGKQTVRETETSIPDPDYEGVNITAIRLFGKDLDLDPQQYTPVTTYGVPARFDSLNFTFQIMNNRPGQPLNFRSRLLRFEADSSPSIPMNFNNYSASSLPYKGIEYSSYEVIEQVPRVVDQTGSVNIEFQTPLLPQGNYRFEVSAENKGADQFFKARDFSIKPENYPTLQTPRELAEPLVYLMDRRDHERLMSLTDDDSLKAAIDLFWISNIGNTNIARSVITKFYERVEEANKQFSNFKEGWKTDPGMIYILFGQPWYDERRLKIMQWSYSYDRADPSRNFYFESPRIRSEFFPFEHYILQRNRQYYNVQYQQKQLWLSGRILTMDI